MYLKDVRLGLWKLKLQSRPRLLSGSWDKSHFFSIHAPWKNDRDTNVIVRFCYEKDQPKVRWLHPARYWPGGTCLQFWGWGKPLTKCLPKEISWQNIESDTHWQGLSTGPDNDPHTVSEPWWNTFKGIGSGEMLKDHKEMGVGAKTYHYNISHNILR